MNHPASPPDAAALSAEWAAANDEVLRLGFEWLGARIAAISDERRTLLEEIDERRRTFDSARDAMEREGRPSALDSLSQTFNLAPFDADVLLLVLAAQVDLEFGARLGDMQARSRSGHVRLGDIAPLLAADASVQPSARARLSPDAALRRFCLVEVEGRGASAILSLDERIAALIQGQDFVDPRLAGLFRIVPSMPVTSDLHALSEALSPKIAIAPRPSAVLVGPKRSGRRAVAQEIAAQFGLTLAEIDLTFLPATPGEWRALLPLISREAALLRLGLLVDSNPDTKGEEGASTAPQFAREAAQRLDALVLILSEEPVAALSAYISVRLPPLTAAERMELWRAALPQGEQWLGLIADHFAFGPVEIAWVAAQFHAKRPDPAAVWASCRDHAGSRLDGLAQRLEPRRSWDSIVLPAPVLAELHAVAAQVRHRPTVYGEWGYDALLPRGRGVSVLFAGPSGAGKTLAAEIIAHELSLDLYCIDLAGVVSKYIGETEKNLKSIFDAAEESGAVLFIDEADALFGKRSEVKDSHDRYANVEVSYLLQRMESYAGLAILATNLKNHIDFAFMRRIRNVIDIPFPDFAHRLQIWRKSFPEAAPLDGIDFERLASLEIAGGNIVVVATNAAFLAAAEGSAIAMRHIAQAARAEFRKLDRTLDPTFGAAS